MGVDDGVAFDQSRSVREREDLERQCSQEPVRRHDEQLDSLEQGGEGLPEQLTDASSEQVRQPIYKGGVEQWKHYEEWLDPLVQALGPVLDAYPEVPPL